MEVKGREEVEIWEHKGNRNLDFITLIKVV